jgi:hypothetical protein
MAKKQALDTALFDTLRATGLRKKVARTISASGARADGNQPLLVQQTVRGLRMAATAIENRAPDSKSGTDGRSTKTGNAKKRPARASKSRPGSRSTAKRTSARTASGTKRAARSRPTRANQRRTGARSQTRTRA